MEKVGLVAAIVLPFWNIPLILKIIKRRSSRDISLPWALGVWGCLLLMAPAGFTSPDTVFRVFNMINFVFFTAVVGVILKYYRS